MLRYVREVTFALVEGANGNDEFGLEIKIVSVSVSLRKANHLPQKRLSEYTDRDLLK